MENANGGKINPAQTRTGHDHLLDDLADADTVGAAAGDALVYTGDAWAPGAAVPTGTMIASGVAYDKGILAFLPCLGKAYSRTDFADLFEAIGTIYGAGDGSTTFLVPHCTGTFGGVPAQFYIRT
jgi:hypothetical protein